MQYYARDTCKTSPFKWWQLKSLLLRQMDFTGHLTECSKNCMTSCWWLYCQKRRSWDLIVKKTPGKEMEKNSEKNFNPDYNLRKCLECCEDQDLRKSSRFKELEKKKKRTCNQEQRRILGRDFFFYKRYWSSWWTWKDSLTITWQFFILLYQVFLNLV